VKRLADLIMVVDGVASEEMCADMIQKFDQTNLGFHKRVSQLLWKEDYRQYTEVNMFEHPDFKDINEHLVNQQITVYDEYRKRTGSIYLPPVDEIGFEVARMKKYADNDYDQFGWHVDVGDDRSAKRALAMYLYLNDVEEGGETLFDVGMENPLTVVPKRGRMVVFPPHWMFPHKANKPVSGPKYVATQFIHYL
jgi:prolyl 4-hydroxylase